MASLYKPSRHRAWMHVTWGRPAPILIWNEGSVDSDSIAIHTFLIVAPPPPEIALRRKDDSQDHHVQPIPENLIVKPRLSVIGKPRRSINVGKIFTVIVRPRLSVIAAIRFCLSATPNLQVIVPETQLD